MKKDGDFNLILEEDKKNIIGLLVENNFDKIFNPITTESLRFFLPLNGVCLIDYQLHFFKINNIKKIYIVVTHHEKELQKYIEKFQKSKKKYGSLDIEIIKMNFRIKTLGDVLRDFKKCVDIIYTDVLLLLSDTVPIANIQDIIKAHFINKEKCKNQIMTVMLSYNLNENRPYNDQFVVGYDVLTFKLLLYESLKNKKYLTLTDSLLDNMNDNKGKKGKQKTEKSAYARTNSDYTTASSDRITASSDRITSSSDRITASSDRITGSSDNFINISNESINSNQIMNYQGGTFNNNINNNHIYYNDFRYKIKKDSSLDTSTNAFLFFYDSVIPNIFIITPQVFKLFEQNFDYQCMHKDFIYNILNQEIKIEEIYVYELNNDYNYTECNQIISTLSDFRMYFNFYKTILERHIHPFISKASYLLPDLPKLVYTEPGIYKAKNVTIDETCKLLKLVSIDKYTYILANTIIENSIICKNCKIGKNVKIYNSIIGKNTIIKNNVTILGSYISENNIINDHVFINECCVIGRNTNIPANMEIQEYTRLSVYQYLKDKMTLNQKHKKCTNDTTVEPTNNTTVEPINDTTVEPTNNTTVEPTNDTTVELTNNTTVEPTNNTTVEPTNNTTVELTNDTTVEPTNNTTVEPINDTTVEPTNDTAVEPINDTTVEPINDTAAEPINDTTVEPINDTAAEPINDTTVEPINDTAAEPTNNTTVEPINNITTDSTITNTQEPTNEHKKNEQYENEHIVIIDPSELYKYIIKMKYSKDELRLFSLVGNIENYEKKQNKNLLTYDSFDESDHDSTGYVSTSDNTLSEINTCDKNLSDLDGSDLDGSKLDGSKLDGSDIKREVDKSGITSITDDTVANKSKNLSVILNDINTEFDKKNIENDKYIFNKEICLLCKEAIEKPQLMSHKILEMKSFRLSLNYKDIDVLICFFPIIWNGINNIEFEKDTWVSYFDKNKIDLLFSSFLLEDQLYYETIYDLILQYSKQKFLENNVINNLYGPDKLCNIFEFLYHSDIFEFNYFKEWIDKNKPDEYLTNNKRLQAFAEWLSDE
ncbi:conserved protein, unknown function [Hepatocystis sp. ex Piliocolobus tephrosceles]|nr:conserved protein, unknown function [Hepatocystis sp. ex Piliocolobus tephrosceles]